MRSPTVRPGAFNIGSQEMVTINALAQMIADIAGKSWSGYHIAGPLGVRGAQPRTTA